MTILFVHNCEGYTVPNAVTVVDSATGSGSALNAVTTVGSSTVIASATAAHGSVGIATNSGGTAQRAYVEAALATSYTTLGFRFNVNRAATPTVNMIVARLLDASNNPVADIRWNTSGKLEIRDATQTIRATGVTTLDTASTWDRIAVDYTAGASTGVVVARLYNAVDSASVDDTVTATNFNFGSGAKYLRVGNVGDNNAGITIIDDIRIDDAHAVPAYSGGEAASGSTPTIPAKLLVNTGEGLADATAVTTANSGGASGDAWTTITKDGSGTILGSTTNPAHGLVCHAFDTASVANKLMLIWDLGTDLTLLGGRCYLRRETLPGTAFIVARGYSDSVAAVPEFDIQINTSGYLIIRDSTQTTRATGTVAINTAAYSRIEYDYTAGTSAGIVVARLYTSVESVTAAETLTANGFDFGASLHTVGWGNLATNNIGTFRLDSIAVSLSHGVGPFQTGETGTGTGSGGGGGGEETDGTPAHFQPWVWTGDEFLAEQ